MRRRIRKEEGFTLIELMVVVLIIAILIAIAVPTYLGLRERAQNRAAQADLRNGLAAAAAYFADGDTYTGFTNLVGESLEPSLGWQDAAGDGSPRPEVSITQATDSDFHLVAGSASGSFFCIHDDTGAAGVTYGSGAAKTDVDAEAECQDASF